MVSDRASHLNYKIFLDGLRTVDPLDHRVRAGVLEGDAAVLDRLAEHAHHEVPVQNVLAYKYNTSMAQLNFNLL